MTIWLDMDGTIANLYAVEDWRPRLEAHDPTPYEVAKPLVHMATLARLLNKCQKQGYKIGIVSALAGGSTPIYDNQVVAAKQKWLKRHLPSVRFDEICFLSYTDVKNKVNHGKDILVDDEPRHLKAWTGTAINATNLFTALKALA